MLRLAESLEEDHRASDLAVCAKFRSQVVAQLFQKVFGEQGFDGARSDCVDVHLSLAGNQRWGRLHPSPRGDHHRPSKRGSPPLQERYETWCPAQSLTTKHVMRPGSPEPMGAVKSRHTCQQSSASIVHHADGTLLPVSRGRLAQTSERTARQRTGYLHGQNAIQRASPTADLSNLQSAASGSAPRSFPSSLVVGALETWLWLELQMSSRT